MEVVKSSEEMGAGEGECWVKGKWVERHWFVNLEVLVEPIPHVTMIQQSTHVPFLTVKALTQH